MAMRERLFLFVLTAARAGSDKPGRRALLAYSCAATVDDAIDRADRELKALGWDDFELQAAKEVLMDPAAEPDPIASDAISRALAHGFAQISY